ncbi:MAG TPA: hypothetical protein VMQ58_02805 [Candidatus Saccharimonadales bacterium]|jgi:hypothetical protein|nr:hypothetical protein [Candidatus Saccharimonadales bacterium]
MENLDELLKNKSFNEPYEIRIIKDFIKMNFEDNCLIKVSNLKIQIVVSNSSLAGALKENLESLKHQLKTKKDISIRIGRI